MVTKPTTVAPISTWSIPDKICLKYSLNLKYSLKYSLISLLIPKTRSRSPGLFFERHSTTFLPIMQIALCDSHNAICIIDFKFGIISVWTRSRRSGSRRNGRVRDGRDCQHRLPCWKCSVCCGRCICCGLHRQELIQSSYSDLLPIRGV